MSEDSVRYREDFMLQTNNGGRLEFVPGFNSSRVIAQQFQQRPLPPRLRQENLGDSSGFEFAFPQSAIGKDDRVPVPNASALPWRCICQLVIEGLHDQQTLGTGWLAGPRTVITAGHNLYSFRNNRKATRVYVVPGREGNVAPFNYYQSTRFDVHEGWGGKGLEVQDLGVIWLGAPVGEKLGWFGMASYSDDQLSGLIVNTAGYPVDKRLGTQWFNAGRVDSVDQYTLRYGLDTEGGQSGSPVFEFDSDNRRITHAIHVYGGPSSNAGIRINNGVYDLIMAWMQ